MNYTILSCHTMFCSTYLRTIADKIVISTTSNIIQHIHLSFKTLQQPVLARLHRLLKGLRLYHCRHSTDVSVNTFLRTSPQGPLYEKHFRFPQKLEVCKRLQTSLKNTLPKYNWINSNTNLFLHTGRTNGLL